MLEGRIDVENEVIDALTKRYEKERDQLLELAEVKRSALTEELDMLDEQLEARKKLNDKQDQAKLLAEKEAQFAQIAADPTRKKEELALREEIAKLREEIAWDLAEEEVEAQKKSIQSQIDSIDDYMDYIDSYYEALLSNPRKLIEEMQTLLSQADAGILGWLMANHEDYRQPRTPPANKCASTGRRCWTICAAIRRPIGMRWRTSSLRGMRRSSSSSRITWLTIRKPESCKPRHMWTNLYVQLYVEAGTIKLTDHLYHIAPLAAYSPRVGGQGVLLYTLFCDSALILQAQQKRTPQRRCYGVEEKVGRAVTYVSTRENM